MQLPDVQQWLLYMLAALAVMCVVGHGMTGYDYDAVSL